MDAEELDRINFQRRANDVLNRHHLNESRRMRGIETTLRLQIHNSINRHVGASLNYAKLHSVR